MLYDVAGYQVDKVKFLLELEPHQLPSRLERFQEVFGHAKGPNGGKAYNVVSVGKASFDGGFKYVFDVWGENAANADQLDFQNWYPYLDRIDLKKGMTIHEEGLENLYQYLNEKLGKNRKLTYQQAPIHQKRGNRDSGGHSLALGSHKSDLRVHWTRRGFETGYQEFQIQKTKLHHHLIATGYWLEHPLEYTDATTWNGLAKRILVGAQCEVNDITGLWDWDIENILSGRLDAHGIMEQKLMMIERDINKLPKSALFALYDALNERLFGLPQESDGTTEQEYYVDTHQDEE